MAISMHIFHKWPKWSAPTSASLYHKPGFSNKIIELDGQIQDRTCEICGAYEWRKI